MVRQETAILGVEAPRWQGARSELIGRNVFRKFKRERDRKISRSTEQLDAAGNRFFGERFYLIDAGI